MVGDGIPSSPLQRREEKTTKADCVDAGGVGYSGGGGGGDRRGGLQEQTERRSDVARNGKETVMAVRVGRARSLHEQCHEKRLSAGRPACRCCSFAYLPMRLCSSSGIVSRSTKAPSRPHLSPPSTASTKFPPVIRLMATPQCLAPCHLSTPAPFTAPSSLEHLRKGSLHSSTC